MCVICDENKKVVSICLIPGIGYIPNDWSVFFPWNGSLPYEGALLTDEQIAEQGVQVNGKAAT